MLQGNENKSKRNKEICKKLISGKTYTEIARQYKLTSEMVRLIFRKEGGKTSQLKAIRLKSNYAKAIKKIESLVTTKGYVPNAIWFRKFLWKYEMGSYAKSIRKEIIKKTKLLTTVERANHKSKEVLINDLKRIYAIYKRPIGKKDLIAQKAHSTLSYIYHFGTFINACKIAKVPNALRGGNRLKKIIQTRKKKSIYH